jgi:MOSC domain-containing protein YiiM
VGAAARGARPDGPYVGGVDAPAGTGTTPCASCGFDRAEWTRGDATRTLAHAEALIAAWSAGAVGAEADVLAARGRALVAEVAAAGELTDRVHALWHGLVSIADLRRAGGHAVPLQRGVVTQLNRSGGGVPKAPVASASVGIRGLGGDVQATRVHHGRPWQALCLWSADVIAALVDEGHPVEAGTTGENITIAGVDWTLLRGGTVVDIGAVRCQLSAPTTPCRKIRRWFRDGAVGRIDHERHPGWSRWYASVLRPGTIVAGDVVLVEPVPTV